MKKIILFAVLLVALNCYAQLAGDQLISQVNSEKGSSLHGYQDTSLLPDLVGDHSAVSDLNLAPGESFVLYHSVMNIGDAVAAPSVTKFYFSNDQIFGDGDDIYIDQATCGSLGIGEVQYFTPSLTVPVYLSSGTWYLFFKVDANSSVSESNEDNNVEMVSWAFTIGDSTPQITVISPNGGETWQAGGSYNINWIYSNVTGNVRIDLMQGTNTTPVLTITASTPINSMSHNWTIPTSLNPASNYKIKITCLSYPAVNDLSNSYFTISPAPTIIVISPNGGEVWQEESTYAITWTYLSLTGNVKIELMQGTSTTPVLTINPMISISMGSYDWLIPASLNQANNYKVKITSLSNGAIFDSSNDYFTINPAPSLTVTVPNGGEVWLIDSSNDITWTSANLSGNVKIELMQGTNTTPVITINPSIAVGVGSYNWTIPSALDPAANYKVKVTSLQNTAVYDLSNNYFTINPAPSITVLSPNGGETWLQGGSYAVNWTYASLSGNVRIDLLQGTSTTPVLTISSSTPVSTGSYNWTIPASINPASNFRVKITSLSDTSVYDLSNSYFTINPAASITVISPNGGEIWQEGSTYAVSWTYLSLTGNVKIELMQGTNPAPVLTINPSIAISSGSYDWLIPSSLDQASDYKVKITSLDNPSVNDLSNDYFTINPAPSITVTSPNGGETWLKGSTEQITWSCTNMTGDVKIELMQGTSVISTVSSSVDANSGTFAWTIPTDLNIASNYKIKITSLSVPTVYDESDGTFTIATTAITVQSPNGMEIWISGVLYEIMWSVQNISGNVKIELYRGTGSDPVATIHSSVAANEGSYNWNIPSLPTASDYKVKITSLVDLSVFDFSDGYFTIEGYTPNDDQVQSPGITALTGNFPNPFNPQTSITYSLAQRTEVSIKIFNNKGQMVRHLFSGIQEPGFYTITWDGLSDEKRSLTSGIYTVSMNAGACSSKYKITMMK